MRIRPLVFVGALALASVACSQVGKDKYKPNEVQGYRLKIAQDQALIASQAKNAADAAFNKALADLQSEATKVIQENKWPADTQFDPQKLVFFPAPATPPAKAPTEPKAK